MKKIIWIARETVLNGDIHEEYSWSETEARKQIERWKAHTTLSEAKRRTYMIEARSIEVSSETLSAKEAVDECFWDNPECFELDKYIVSQIDL